ncbi:MAG: cold shock domain-containing protein [Pseudomonadota bacterium]
MNKGTEKWFNATKGIGYIQPDDSDKDVFVHKSASDAARTNELTDGQDVTLGVETDGKGRDFVANMALA